MTPSTVLYYYISPALAILALLLNSALVYNLVRQYRRNNRGGERKHPIPLIFLANLALSDLLVGLTLVVIKGIVWLNYYKLIRWSLALAWAFHIMKFAFLRFSLLTSVFNLASLTMDRFLAIRYPMVYRMKVNTKQALVVVGITWLLSTIFTAVHYSITNFSGIALWQYDLVIFPAVVFPATLIFAICYSLILLTIRKQGRKMRGMMSGQCTKELECNNGWNPKLGNGNGARRYSEMETGSRKVSNTLSNIPRDNGRDIKCSSKIAVNNNTCAHISDTKASDAKRPARNSDTGVSETKISGNRLSTGDGKNSTSCQRGNKNSRYNVPVHVQKREIKIYRFVGIVVGIFLLCWLPIAICGVILMKRSVNALLVNSVFTLAFANSVIDPIVYFIFNCKVGHKIMRLFRLMSRCARVKREGRLRRTYHLFSSSSEGSNSELSRAGRFSNVVPAETVL